MEGKPRTESSFIPAKKDAAPDSRGIYAIELSNQDFMRLSEFIRSFCGIKFPPAKKAMLEGRLRKRLMALNFQSFGRYCEYLFGLEGAESEYMHMIDAVTTNKTDFFRESDHFDYLVETALPEIVRDGVGPGKRLHVWSAASSTGEEPYTLAMVLSEFAQGCAEFQFSILGTDISSAVLEKARRAIYDQEKATSIPMTLRRKYLLKGKDKNKGLVRIIPELRASVEFKRLNLMEDDYGIEEPMGIVFCRNVLIYFDRQTQEKIIQRLSNHLMPGGYLFVGHSENLHGMDLPLIQTSTTVYRK